METKWYKPALFAGMTPEAFKLGTVLSLGWFWMRPTGCVVLYSGQSMHDVDFENILAVGNVGSETISPPAFIEHEHDTNYFYVVRGVNCCGLSEQSLDCAAKVSFDSDGDLKGAKPNSVFEASIRQIAGCKAELIWFYCPIEQGLEPDEFKIYCDAGSGQIDYENPLAQIEYIGRRFYYYQSQALAEGTYQFDIRAENQNSDESAATILRIDIKTETPAGIDILDIEEN